MTCPHNSLGQPACYITAHPDYPNESFCLTCSRRFSTPSKPEPSQPESSSQQTDLLVLIIAVFLLILLLKLISTQPSNFSPPTYNYKGMTQVQ